MIDPGGGAGNWSRRERRLLAVFLGLLSLAALSAWSSLPIYPDEIGYRVKSARHIPDRGLVHGIWSVCASNVKEVPSLLLMPAWLASWLDGAFTPVEARLFPFMASLATVILAILCAVRHAFPGAAAFAATALLGVAGSGVTMARPEYLQLLNVACALAVLCCFEPVSKHPLRRGVTVILLLLSGLVSVHSHLQGLLFLPLTLFVAGPLVAPRLGAYRNLLVTFALGVLIVPSVLRFHSVPCKEYPRIEEFRAEMHFRPTEVASMGLLPWLERKLNAYTVSFQYTPTYPINYLPGVSASSDDVQARRIQDTLNLSIRFILLVNLLLSLVMTIRDGLLAVGAKAIPTPISIPDERDRDQALSRFLLSAPVLLLFLYDPLQHFYRSFFLNFVLAVFLAVSLSKLAMGRMRLIATGYLAFSTAVVAASLAANMWWFAPSLEAGYEGPSLSVQKDWEGIDRAVEALSRDCEIDLEKGRIVIDDTTFTALRGYPVLYPITYLALQAQVAGIDMATVIGKVKPNSALARCDVLSSTNLGFRHQRGILCCQNFRDGLLARP